MKLKLNLKKAHKHQLSYSLTKLHNTGCCFQLIFSDINTSMIILMNFMQNSFYSKLIFVSVNSSSFSLLTSLPKTQTHCWKWHTALQEKTTQSGKRLQGNNSSLPALIPERLPPHYYSWNVWSRAAPDAPPRTILWLLGSRVVPPHRGLFSPVKNAGEIGERASLTYFSSSSHPFPSHTHISAPTSKLHIHPRISVGWWKKKKSVGNEALKSNNIFLHNFASVKRSWKLEWLTLHCTVSGEWKEKVKSIKMSIFILDAKSQLL